MRENTKGSNLVISKIGYYSTWLNREYNLLNKNDTENRQLKTKITYKQNKITSR